MEGAHVHAAALPCCHCHLPLLPVHKRLQKRVSSVSYPLYVSFPSLPLFSPLSLSHPFFFDFTYRLDCTTCSSLHSPLQCRTPHSCTSRLKLPTFGSNTTFSLFSPFGFLAYAGRREEKVDKKKRRGGRGMREKEEGKEGRRRECSTLQRPPNLYIHHYVLLVIRLWIISVRGEEKRRRKRGKR